MAVVVRLQGLNIEAGSEDIRRFFDGLQIPGGGVYIIGGSRGEAFIIFATKKDAELAMQRSGGILRGSPIALYLSNQEELQRKMASRFKKRKSSKRGSEKKAKELAEASASDPTTALLLSVFKAIGGLQAQQLGLDVALQKVKNSERKLDHSSAPKEQHKRRRVTSRLNTRYLRLYGLPKSITWQEITQFFEGLCVEDIIINVKIGRSYGCLVKFTEEQDAIEGLKLNHQSMGSFSVKIKEASLEMWVSALECKKSWKECQRKEPSAPVKRYPDHRSKSRSPKRHRSDTRSPSDEFCVKIENIPQTTSKIEIKEFFGCSYIKNNNILHVLDEQGYRTSSAFIIFDNLKDYQSALKLNRSQLYSRTVKVSAVTMQKMMETVRARRRIPEKELGRNDIVAPEPEKPRERIRSQKTCMYVRNLPADVRKIEVKDFFCQFRVREDHITLLHDRQGIGIGEALVRLKSEDVAKMAESLNGNVFLGNSVLVTCITQQQMEDLLYCKH